MANFSFECKECGFQYDCLASFDETGEYPTVKCPECESLDKTKTITAPSVVFKNPVGTDKWNNSHSYRFGHKAEEAGNLRRAAEQGSHVGRNPYKDDPTANDDDINSGQYFGEAK